LRPHLFFAPWCICVPLDRSSFSERAVLSVAKLALGQEAYYEQQVALGLDDYYAGRGESPGLWVGSGAKAIELVGTVEEGALSVLLSGLSPADGQRLRAPARQRTITARTLDEATGIWRDEPKTLAPVAGYDLVFSCPKSVSLLHALTGDEDVRRAISDAHEASWQAALSYLEAEACVVRRGRGGAIRECGEGFVAAAFRHRTSRAQDPHLHTHVIVANLARSPDGAWRALDGEAILRTYRLAAGYLYESHLRHELTASLGVRWTEPVKGMAEIEGVPEEALRAFSTRRQSLVEHMEAMGTSGFAASRVAALATRERKEAVTSPTFASRGSPAPGRWASEPSSSEASSRASRPSRKWRRSTLRTSPPTRPPSRHPTWSARSPAPPATA
jgi:conjugative relaxase-like TrwC/TraI family protein